MSDDVIRRPDGPIKVAVIMGKMNPGGKKSLAMEYFRNTDQDTVQYHFICDADSTAVPEEEIRALGGKVSYIAPYQSIIANMRDLERLCKREGFDVMHAYNSTMNIFPLRVAKKCGIPVRISESLSMGHEKEAKTALKKVLRRGSKLFATDFMSCGEDCGRWQFGDALFDSGAVKVFKTAIDPSKSKFDEDIRRSMREELGISDRRVFGFIGRFEAQKNPLFLIDVFAAISKRDPKATLLLVGDGSYRDEMEERIRDHGIESRVVDLGVRDDVHALYQAMDAFLLPSLYEGLPIVGLEAQCAGLPTFFSTETTREVSFSSKAHFISLDEPAEKWAERILQELRSDAAPREGLADLATRAGFDVRSEAKRLADLYIESLNAKGGDGIAR